ncbi:hypothetical protein ACSNOI_00810 [Actinomadura kijaniata]|uniref:hypothetical protein n=1 Tax=Actinomadura kijaniata TaxID=46161 RepID=UPI003F1C80FA
MNITVIGRGRLGGGLAGLWRTAGHHVTELGRQGGDASAADVIVVAVPGPAIGEALDGVAGLAGQVTIDATNVYGPRATDHLSLSHQIKSVVGGPTAKAFSTNFAALYGEVAAQRTRPDNLYAADLGAREAAERLSLDAGYDPLYIGDLDPGARILEDGSKLTRAIAAQIGPHFYRYASPGRL